VDETLSELELQHHLQRFATQFADRVTQATETLERTSPTGVRDEALRKNLLYVSSALEIATGPDPEVNLLDMVVFVRLSRAALEHHWIPEVYRESGAELLEVFARSEQELRAVAEAALRPAQRAQLAHLVEAWLEENPAQIRVEGIRLADFAEAAGSAAAERAIEAKGLLSSVATASQAANQAMLLSERGLFLFHRLPFLWRLQARLAARDMLSDAATQLLDGPQAPVARLRRQARDLVGRASTDLAVLAATGTFVWWLGARARRES
jgi:hypothetical protein